MRYSLTLKTLSPIAHGDTTVGSNSRSNTRVFMRQNQMVGNIPAAVPAVSENALRTAMIRSPLHDDLVARLDIKEGELPQSVVNLLWSGGSMAAGSKAPAQAMQIGHDVKKTYPSLDLLGGAVDGFILPRSRLKVNAWLVCVENRLALSHLAPELAERATLSAFDMIAEETRTRGTGDDSDGNQMIYTYETLSAQAEIFVEFTLDPHTAEVTQSALGAALAAFDGFIGGQSRQGRGRVVIADSNVPSGDMYNQYIADNAEALKNGLISGEFCSGFKICA